MKDLLQLLELSNSNLSKWLYGKEIIGLNESLPDLAFRLRDEVCKNSIGCDNYHKALYYVYRAFCKSQKGTVQQNLDYYRLWLEGLIEPTEMIVATLIVQEQT